MTYKINYVDYGIGNRFSDNYIELNKNLKKPEWKILHDQILEHEKEHTDKDFRLNDFLMDLNPSWDRKLYWKFVLFNPSTWVQFSPIYKSRGTWHIDFSLILTYMIGIIIVSLIVRGFQLGYG